MQADIPSTKSADVLPPVQDATQIVITIIKPSDVNVVEIHIDIIGCFSGKKNNLVISNNQFL